MTKMIVLALLLASVSSRGTVSRLLVSPEQGQAGVRGAAVQQRLQCWDQTGQRGESVVATDYMPYISYHNMDNRIESCCFNGIWVLYGDEQYNYQNTNSHNWWAYGDDYCTDVPQQFMNEASSLRYTGHPEDYRRDSINMYFNDYFMGDEEFRYSDTPYLNYDNRAKSIIVTGTSWWTIYQNSNFGGYAACLAPGQSGSPAFYFQSSDLQGLGGDISSVALGCFAKDKIYPANVGARAANSTGGQGFH